MSLTFDGADAVWSRESCLLKQNSLGLLLTDGKSFVRMTGRQFCVLFKEPSLMNGTHVEGAGKHLWQAVSIPVHHSSPLESTLTLSYKLPLGNPANPDLMKDALAEYVHVLPAWKYPVLGTVDSGQHKILGYMTVMCSATMEHLYHTPSPWLKDHCRGNRRAVVRSRHWKEPEWSGIFWMRQDCCTKELTASVVSHTRHAFWCGGGEPHMPHP